jgi:hypothetical protein
MVRWTQVSDLRLVHVFAGAPRPHDVEFYAWRKGFASVESYDASQPGGNVLAPALRADLLARARRGDIHRLVGGPPCRTCSPSNRAGVVKRTREELWPHVSNLPPEWVAYVLHDNECYSFMAELALPVYEAGGEFVIENPADLGDPESPIYRPSCANAPSCFVTPPFVALREAVPCVMVIFPQCGLGAPWRKLTGLLCSPGVGAKLVWLQYTLLVPPLGCACARHAARAFGRDASGSSQSKASAAWNGPMCRALVDGLAEVEETPPLSSVATSVAGGISGGRVADGQSLHVRVAAACEEQRTRPARFIDLRSLAAADWAELDAAPMPVMPPLEAPLPPVEAASDATLTDASSASDPGDAVLPPHPWDVSMVPKPKHWQRAAAWLAAAEVALLRWADGDRSAPSPHECVITRRQTRRCFRGKRLAFADGDGHVLRPSTAETVFPGPMQLDRAAFAATARKHGYDRTDPDIVAQAGGGGVESRSVQARPYTTTLRLHHPGVRENFEVAAAGFAKEEAGGAVVFVTRTFPFWPLNCLPRDVAWADRYKPDESGAMQLFPKPRLTIDPSCGADPLNGGVPEGERTVRMPYLSSFARGCAISAAGHRRAQIGTALYQADVQSAYPHLVLQVLEHPRHCTVWVDVVRRAVRVGYLPRMAFGGAYGPQRWCRVMAPIDDEVAERVDAFDAAYPPPAHVREWSAARRRLQAAGELPAGAAQLPAANRQRFIDDLSGCAGADVVPFPPPRGAAPELVHIDVGAAATVAMGGVPAHPSCRAAMHLRIALQTWADHGITWAPDKTLCGDPIVSLGARVGVLAWRVDTPPLKAAALLTQVEEQRAWLDAKAPLPSVAVAKLTGRLSSVSEHEPLLLSHLHGGFSLVAAALKRRFGRSVRGFTLRELRLKPGGRAAQQYLRMLSVAGDLIAANAGVPLGVRAAFPPITAAGVATSSTDASFAASDDGVGGFVFVAGVAGVVWMVSEPWPPWAKAALERGARTRAAKLAAPASELSMPVAELFGCVAVPVAAAAAGAPMRAVCAVGDCDPAAAALNRGSSPRPPMRSVLVGARELTRAWLGVSVPRDFNFDADRLSHPSMLPAVQRDAEAAGFVVHLVARHLLPWDLLAGAISASEGSEALA